MSKLLTYVLIQRYFKGKPIPETYQYELIFQGESIIPEDVVWFVGGMEIYLGEQVGFLKSEICQAPVTEWPIRVYVMQGEVIEWGKDTHRGGVMTVEQLIEVVERLKKTNAQLSKDLRLANQRIKDHQMSKLRKLSQQEKRVYKISRPVTKKEYKELKNHEN